MSEVRLIDANALMERFAEMQQVKPDKDGQEYACNFLNMGGEPSVEWFTVLDAVENAPTVDAAPVTRAHWRMYSYDEAICSHCGYDRLTEFECTSEAKERWGELPKFCENCGAKMDERADGERRSE